MKIRLLMGFDEKRAFRGVNHCYSLIIERRLPLLVRVVLVVEVGVVEAPLVVGVL